MKRFEIGPGVTCDLDKLVDSRLLVQANSGGGKSYLLRRLLEQTHGHVQHLVIDPEGEFASLRERFDYVLAAKHGGDTAAEPRAAALLAERLLDLKVSAILDIYELKPHDRIRFVRLFLEALVDAPKALWHPALVVVDEAHVYCPQVGEAESAGAVKDLATRGRKRGFCAVLATQRLSKLHKDAAAECNNKLIGRTSLDVDMDRAADEIGVPRRDRDRLRELQPGEFYAYGPAFNFPGVAKVKVGGVETTHPKAGARLAFSAPPPTSKVKALLPKLADLPAEAEERAKSVEELKQEVANLRREVTIAKKAQPAAEVKTVERAVLKDGQLTRAEKLIERMVQEFQRMDTAVAVIRNDLAVQMTGLSEAIRSAAFRRPEPVIALRIEASPPAPRRTVAPPVDGLTDTQQRIIDTVAMLNVRGIAADRVSVARWMSIHPNGGRYGSDIARLREAGYLAGSGIDLTDAGRAAARALPTGLDAAREALTEQPQRELLDAAVALFRDERVTPTRENVAERLGIHPNGGRYGSNIARLREMGIFPDRGTLTPQEGLFR